MIYKNCPICNDIYPRKNLKSHLNFCHGQINTVNHTHTSSSSSPNENNENILDLNCFSDEEFTNHSIEESLMEFPHGMESDTSTEIDPEDSPISSPGSSVHCPTPEH